MKLITWNIQWGLGLDGRKDLGRIVAEAKRLADFDVLCLQEVADNFPELQGNDDGDQFAEIAARLPGYAAIAGAAVDVPGEGGRRKRFGNMILSRYPVGQVIRHALPWEADQTRSMPRLAIEAVLTTPFGPLRVVTTHLEYYSPRLRRAQIEGLREIHRQAAARAALPPRPATNMFRPWPATASAIVTADFNMAPSDPGYARLLEPFGAAAPALIDGWTRLKPGATHPPSFCLHDQSFGKPHCCDFVLVSEELAPRLRTIQYDLETQASDHQPVVVELADSI